MLKISYSVVVFYAKVELGTGFFPPFHDLSASKLQIFRMRGMQMVALQNCSLK